MVFRGKPSAACLPCRQRRLRCDQLPDGCSSCARRGIECTGYRDTQTTRFCHEAESTSRRYEQRTGKGKVKSRAAGSGSSSSASPSPSPSSAAQQNPLVFTFDERSEDVQAKSLPPPSIPLVDGSEDSAVRYCERAYQLPTGVVERLDGELSRTPIPDCIKALGLATSINVVQNAEQSDLLDEAHRYYRSALQKTNSALASPHLARRDETLLAVMVLSDLETILNPGLDSLNAWSAHAKGCASLLDLRGMEQFQTQEGRELFITACENVLLDCLRLGVRVPEHLHTLCGAAKAWIDGESTEHTFWMLLHFRLRLADFYADFMSGSLQAPEAVIDETYATDQALVDALQRVPLRTNPSNSQQASGIWKLFVASQSRIGIMAVRMLSHILILAILRQEREFLDGEMTAEREIQVFQSTQTVETLQEQLLASMPGHIQLVEEHNRLSDGSSIPSLMSSPAGISNVAVMWAEQLVIGSLCPSSFLDLSQVKHANCRLSRGYHLIRPLMLVAQTANAESSQRQRACQQLRSIGQSLGMVQARYIADALDPGSASENLST